MSLFNNYGNASIPASVSRNSYNWFNADTGRYLFQASVNIFRNNFSGLLFLKPLGASRRVLFITETGIKIFDLELFMKKDFTVHYCIEQINRKPVMKIVGNDLSLMIFSVAGDGKIKFMEEQGTGKTVIKSKDDLGTRFCKINSQTGKVDELISRGTFSDKMNIRFLGLSGTTPDSIDISHHNLKLEINLTKIDGN